MNKKFKKILFVFLIGFLLTGCAAWQLVGSQYKWNYAKFEAVLPEGWMKFNSPTDLLFLTKDGEFLQTIRLFRFAIGKDKELPITKKKFTNEMLPQEIAELIVNEMSLDQNKQNLKIIENVPADISGRNGFRLEYIYNTTEKLKLESIMYGFKENKFIYLIRYQAAEQYYFAKDLTTFKDFVNSFKILK